MADLIIGVLVAVAVAAIIWKKIKDFKEGKSGCGCGCSGCKGSCPSFGNENEKSLHR